MWRLADYQGRLIANLIVAGKHAPDRARAFRRMLAARAARVGRRTFVASDRHRLEVNYYDYRRLMKRLNRRLGRCAR
jgi:alkanesulfonate monooxygenase SsuD/methylene tetrahydromethanopterin reductase-like flavin-dependent oxidoreductase (luciferase family)